MTDPRAWLDQVDARTNAATDGPWEVVEEVRHFYDNPAHPEDECAWCESAVPLAPEEVEGGHAHLLEPHLIRSIPARDHVAGNFDYEEGGIVNGHDTRFIAHARTDLPATTTALRAVLDRETAIRAIAAAHGVEPEQVDPADDGWLIDLVAQVLETAITTALEGSAT